jgi:branched-chain amino acid transport system ATP-binding protein
MTFLCAQRIYRQFYGFYALEDVSLTVGETERRALIGPNGAGKSTLFNILGGQMPASSGLITFDGRDITGAPSHVRARLGMARTFQRNNLFAGLSVLENIRLAVQAHSSVQHNLLSRAESHREVLQKAEEVLERMRLRALAHRVARELSYGDQRKLEVAIALAGSPRLLFVDEPAAGMSPAETREMVAVLAGLPRDIALIIVEHDMDVVAALADTITVLQNGRVIAEGPWQVIREDAQVQRAYMGSKKAH